MKKLFSLLTAAVFACTLCRMPVTGAVSHSGTCGEKLTWTFEDGMLTVSGTGNMDCDYNRPWEELRADIRSVVIGEGVTRIASEAFIACENLSQVQLPETLTYIGEFAFSRCAALEEIEFPDSVQFLETGCFEQTGLRSVHLPPMLSILNLNLFSYCESLTEVTMPENCVILGNGCFEHCTSLRQIELPASVHVLCNSTFSYTALEEIVIPENVQLLGDHCFQNCKDLERVTLPDKLVTIGKSCFADCESLTPEGLQIPDSVTEIYGTSVAGCTKWLADKGDFVTVGDGILCLYQGQEYAVSIPAEIKSVAPYAFFYCESLQSVRCEAAITKLKQSTFVNCPALTEVEIPPSCTAIDSAFADRCPQLKTILGEPGSAAHIFAAENGYDFVHSSGDLGETYYPDREHDTFSFGNAGRYLGSSYRTDPWLEAELFDYSGVPADTGKVLRDNWSGACYGLSALTILVQTGAIPLSALDENAACLHDVQPTERVRALVNYYQLTQKLPAVFTGSYDINLKTQFARMNKAAQCAQNVNHGGEPFIITVNTQSGNSHALVGYGLEAGEWEWDGVTYNRRILIWDSNYISETEKTAIYFDAVTMHWTLPAYGISFAKDAQTDTGGLLLVVQGSDILNACPYDGMKPLPGDTDRSDTLSIADAVLLTKQLTEADTIPTYTGRENADFDGDGVLTLSDLGALLRALS